MGLWAEKYMSKGCTSAINVHGYGSNMTVYADCIGA